MTAHTHITVGRTAIKALLVAVVVTAGITGGVGTAAAEPMDGKGDDPFPPSLFLSLDGKGNDVYPPPGVYASLDGKGNDPFPPSLFESRTVGSIGETVTDVVTDALSIDAVNTYVGRGGGSGKPSF